MGDDRGPVRARPAGEVGVVEAVVTAGSPLVGCSEEELRLREHHGVTLLAISRRGQGIETHLRHTKFEAGDVLVLQGGVEAMPDWLRELGDRKSTRLNSSHANISYAVFCLKKN